MLLPIFLLYVLQDKKFVLQLNQQVWIK